MINIYIKHSFIYIFISFYFMFYILYFKKEFFFYTRTGTCEKCSTYDSSLYF